MDQPRSNYTVIVQTHSLRSSTAGRSVSHNPAHLTIVSLLHHKRYLNREYIFGPGRRVRVGLIMISTVSPQAVVVDSGNIRPGTSVKRWMNVEASISRGGFQMPTKGTVGPGFMMIQYSSTIWNKFLESQYLVDSLVADSGWVSSLHLINSCCSCSFARSGDLPFLLSIQSVSFMWYALL